MRWITSVSLLYLLLATGASARIWHVPGEIPTIEAGLAAAAQGDMVLVAPGTYAEHDLVMKDGVALSGSYDPENPTVIDASGAGRGILCSGLGDGTLIVNLVIVNGRYATGGGGAIYFDGANPRIENCTFRANTALRGGAVALIEASPSFLGCRFEKNTALHVGGGTMVGEGSAPFFDDCDFDGNASLYFGGGLHCRNGAAPRIEHCRFVGNEAEHYGGALSVVDGSTPELLSCDLSGNLDRGEGAGGLWIAGASECRLDECTLEANGASAIKLRDASLVAEFCDFLAHDVAISVAADAIDCVVSRCGFFLNDRYAIETHADFPLQATYNFWGHASGPADAANQAGQGDAVSDLIDYTPWLRDRTAPGDMVTLTGHVDDDETGDPLAGATIAVYPTGKAEPATSDAQGDWYLRLEPGTGYHLEISKFAYETALEYGLDLAPGETRTFDNALRPADVVYDDYRIVDFVANPDPQDTVRVSECGIAHAWFVAEGLKNGLWVPVSNAGVMGRDGTNDFFAGRANTIDYKFLDKIAHIEIPGVFGLKINANRIGAGQAGDCETIVIDRVNGRLLSDAHRDSFLVEVEPYEYSSEWGYRLWAHFGAGLTAGWVTGTAAYGGGSGSTIMIDFAGEGSDPEWDLFRIRRQKDMYTIREVGIAPPKLIEVGGDKLIGGTLQGGVTLPYAYEFEFDMDKLEGLEALTAFYLITEPVMLLGPQPQVVTNALGWIVQVLVANSESNGLGIRRYADEIGLDVWTGADVWGGASFGVGSEKFFEIGLKASLGGEAHLGGALRYEHADSTIATKLYVNGKADVNVGPRLTFGDNDPKKNYACPFNFDLNLLSGEIGGGLAFKTKFEGLNRWQGLELETSVYGDALPFNFYDLPRMNQEFTYGLSIDQENLWQLIQNVATLPGTVADIGNDNTSTEVGNTTFIDDISNFLVAVYNEQVSNAEARVGYDWRVEDIDKFELALDLEIPLPVFPPVLLKFGGGLDAFAKDKHDLGEGYLYKGVPFLLTETASPPTNTVTFFDVVGELWDNVTRGDILAELWDVILQQIIDTFFWWLPNSREAFVLSPTGSTLDISSEAVPAEVDSTYCRYWEWSDGRLHKNATPEKAALFKAYVDKLREVRQEIAGMQYGIGGFHSLRPLGLDLLEPAELTLRYRDEEVSELDEGTLAVYYEDDDGKWSLMPSTVVPDSNLVRTTIDAFRTYTVAPRMPQGDYALAADPERLPADGASEAVITSGPIFNNDGTPVPDGTPFTLLAKDGEIIAADTEPDLEGVQIEVEGQALSFGFRAGEIPGPVEISAESVNGYAKCTLDLEHDDVGQPQPPVITMLRARWRGFEVDWAKSPDPDVAGYLVWYDSDQPGAPYDGRASVWGANSPIFVGMADSLVVDELEPGATYYVAVTAVDLVGNQSAYSEEFAVIVGIEDGDAPPMLALDQNRPNPFNPRTRIDFSLPRPGPVDLKIYDVRGQCVRTLRAGVMPAGRHQAFWRGEDDRGERVGSGVYLYVLRTEAGTRTRKMLVVK